jgi:uncharacterized protein YfdQ (DUF2303 family)
MDDLEKLSEGGIGAAVEAIIEVTRQSQVSEFVTRDDGSSARLVPVDRKLVEVALPNKFPPVFDRIKAHRAFHDVQSFGDYVAKYKTRDSLLMADIDQGLIRVTLDYHGTGAPVINHEEGDQPGQGPSTCDHIASLALLDSDEWKIWDDAEGAMHTQGEFMLFLEQYAKDLTSPDEASILELVRDFAVTEGVEFKSAQRLDNGDRRVTYNKETQTGDLIIPKKLVMSIPLYRGEPAVTLEAHFRYRINAGALKLGFVWHRAYDVRRAAFELAVANASEKSGLPAYFGAVVPETEGRASARQ